MWHTEVPPISVMYVIEIARKEKPLFFVPTLRNGMDAISGWKVAS